ncbi:alpha/beta fold hydrolase [Shewanella canadensis]|uniref:Proline iminopeptidase n=1 Tax=Shewanella canadensis TaxID=271096 RepID=A0A431WXH3_9GAMM|nr:alpha/beta fold hydrolase [Shewanella canadensis]RTR39983.1 alpha/beta fold hydrolase [Shewanella canadensis]
MIKDKLPLIATTIIATSMLSGCGGSGSKTETTGTGVTDPIKSYKPIECKAMLSASQLALLTPGSGCGYLSVPEKHALYGQPASEKNIEIAVIKLASTSSEKKADPLVYLQGGPGGNASASIGQVITSNTFIKNRDVYLVDQRGTGYSKPALFCTEYSGEAGTPEQLQACKARLEKSGVDLNAYNSVQNAHDFIQLRKALSIPEWNLYGISYGTRLATTIMRENSEGTRSVILDGMFPIEVNGISDTPWANYESLNQIVKNCDNTDSCPADDFKVIIEDIIARMHNEGMVTESRVFIQNLLELIKEPVIISYLLAVNEDTSKYQSALASLMADQDDEQDSGEREGNEGSDEEEQFYGAMGLSTVCAEEYPFLNTTALTGANSQGWSASTQVAVNGMYHMGFDKASCKAWNVAAANDIETQAVASELPVLILNGQNDTQTPAAWGALVAKNMPNAQNITNPQGEHGQLMAGFSCFDTLADEFLAKPNQAVDASCVSEIPDVSYEGGDGEEKSASFTFKNSDDRSDTVYMNGVIGSDTLEVMQTLLNSYPQIKTIVMQNVPGSMDDDTNLLASMEIRKRGIATHIPADGMVASGGTDMFLSGVKRTAEAGAKLGVHSWSDGSGKVALDYPRDHQEHVKYLDYYKAIGIDTSFYWYTLEAAPADGIHWMTAEEIAQYGVLTE